MRYPRPIARHWAAADAHSCVAAYCAAENCSNGVTFKGNHGLRTAGFDEAVGPTRFGRDAEVASIVGAVSRQKTCRLRDQRSRQARQGQCASIQTARIEVFAALRSRAMVALAEAYEETASTRSVAAPYDAREENLGAC